MTCRWCTRPVPDLVRAYGAGEYCSASCRFLAEFSEEGVPFALDRDHPCQGCGRIIERDGFQLAVKQDGLLVCAEHVIDAQELAAQASNAIQRRALRMEQLRQEAGERVAAERERQRADYIAGYAQERRKRARKQRPFRGVVAA